MSEDVRYVLRLDGVDKFEKDMGSMNKHANNFEKNMNSLKTSIAGFVSVYAAIDFGKSVVDSLVKYEYFSASLRTMMHGNVAAAKLLQNQLVDLAKTTPFSLEDVQTGTKSLMAYGFQASEITENIKRLGDVSAGVGAPLNDIIYLYGTLRASNRVTLMDIRQFAGRGIPIYEALGKTLHKTENQILDMVHAGKLGFKDVENAFKGMTEEGGQFFKLMDEQSQTVGGKLSNLGDVWEQLKVNIGISQEGILKETITWASDMLSEMTDAIKRQNKIDEVLKEKRESRGETGKEYGGKRNFFQQLFSGETREDQNQKVFNKLQDNIDLYTNGLTSLRQAQTAFDFLKRENDKNELLKKIQLPGEYEGKKDLLENAFKELTDFKKSFWQGKLDTFNKSKKEKEGSKEKELKLSNQSDKVTGTKQVTINVSIQKLVELIKIMPQNMKDSVADIERHVANALLGAVNQFSASVDI